MPGRLPALSEPAAERPPRTAQQSRPGPAAEPDPAQTPRALQNRWLSMAFLPPVCRTGLLLSGRKAELFDPGPILACGTCFLRSNATAPHRLRQQSGAGAWFGGNLILMIEAVPQDRVASFSLVSL